MREDSIQKVKWAVQFIKDSEGNHVRITAVKLSEITGLSRAALYKKHLRPLWDKSYTGLTEQVQSQSSIADQQYQVNKLNEKITEIEFSLKKSRNQNDKLISDLENEKTRSKVYRQDYDNLKERHQKLLHYNLRILRKLHILGIDVSEFDKMETDVDS